MSLAKQMRRFQSQSATFRQSLFGTTPSGSLVTFDYNRGQFPALTGYYSPIKNRQQTEEAGFLEDHDCAVRVIKTAWPTFTPEIDKLILIKEGTEERLLRIDEIQGTHPLSAEWVLGCSAQN